MRTGNGLPDVGAEWTFADRLAWEAGEIGDRLHPEPDFDENGLPIIDDEDWFDATPISDDDPWWYEGLENLDL